MDIYKAAAPDIDMLSPDIYLTNYKEVTAMYVRDDNPLLVPETRLIAGRGFYSFAEHDAIGFSPFGIEDGVNDFEFVQAYKVLNELQPLILKYQGTGKMRGILKENNEKEETIVMGDYTFKINYNGKKSFGLIIQTNTDEFIMAGMGDMVTVSNVNPKIQGYIGLRWEGSIENDTWKTTRLLNGDEGGGVDRIRIKGRAHKTAEKITKFGPILPDNYNANKNKICLSLYSPHKT